MGDVIVMFKVILVECLTIYQHCYEKLLVQRGHTILAYHTPLYLFSTTGYKNNLLAWKKCKPLCKNSFKEEVCKTLWRIKLAWNFIKQSINPICPQVVWFCPQGVWFEGFKPIAITASFLHKELDNIIQALFFFFKCVTLYSYFC